MTSRQRRKNASHCFICKTAFSESLPNLGVLCYACGHRVCRAPISLNTNNFETNNLTCPGAKCSRFDTFLNKWKCYICFASQIDNNPTRTFGECLEFADEDLWGRRRSTSCNYNNALKRGNFIEITKQLFIASTIGCLAFA